MLVTAGLPAQLFTPCPYFLLSQHSWEFPWPLGWLANCWAAPTGLQALWLPRLKTEDRAQRQHQRHQWFDVLYIQNKGSWSNIPPSLVNNRQDMAAVFALGKGRPPVIGGTDVRLAHWLPETSRGARPSLPH